MLDALAAQAGDWAGAGQAWLATVDYSGLLLNRFTRALGMLALVWMTIWVIALVYSGYMQDFEKGPIGLRPHVNKKQGASTIVFDKDVVPYQMDGVDAKCRFYFVYDNAQGKRRRISLGGSKNLQLHIRPSPVPRSASLVQYGFEVHDAVRDIPSHLVAFPIFEPPSPPPDSIEPTPPTIAAYVDKHDLVKKWTDDDDAPIVSISQTELELIADERAGFIREQAKLLDDSSKPGVLNKVRRLQLARERPNVFGTYYVKLQFSKNPLFVLFKHPNRELKMTAWLTVLTSLFSLAMDLWPIDRPESAPAAKERMNAPQAVLDRAPSVLRPARP